MLDRVLVPMGGSEMAERALEYALENHPDADVTVLTVVAEPTGLMGDAMGLALEDDFEAAATERAEAVLERAQELAAEHDAEIDTVIAVGRPAREIVRRAEDYDAIAIGTHGGSLADRLFVGNVAKTVFQRSPVPVITVR
ncbi:universal stress protein [Halopiger goleimassiliensis]|uniref:universal stress protein n=1 Tax=Halopiger goleimassiliensis TaxID=1293048 RepID=UPI000677B369|nr:universal stress protein [Halopiger goleimassiliensis]